MSAVEERGSVGYERTVAFSDGVFAIAITLLVLGLEVPDVPQRLADEELPHAIGDLGQQFVSYFVGFAVMGLFWLEHHRFFARVREFDQTLLVVNLAYLSLIALMPFTTGVFGRYGDVSIAVVLYAVNVAVANLAGVGMARLAMRRGLLSPDDAERAEPLWRSLAPAGVFLLSVPVAFVVPQHAPLVWLLLLVLSFTRRVQRS
jgi:uncharacterized membrane protein